MITTETFNSARILVVDDEPANVHLLRRILARAGYAAVEGSTDPREALARMREFQPDLVLLDLHMPHLNGLQVLERLAREPFTGYLPVVVLSGDVLETTRQQVFAAGARDFIAKPFDIGEIVPRIRSLLETRLLYLELEGQSHPPGAQMLQRPVDREADRSRVLWQLAQVAERRDDVTGEHTRRVGWMAGRIAEVLGLPDGEVEMIRRTAPLHDVGKVAIPDAILQKRGPLTSGEFEVVKNHTTLGARILSASPSELEASAEQVALAHHERWDGTGYPRGISGEEIPLHARIVTVADVCDALSHARPYRPAWPIEEVYRAITRGSGSQFDPQVVEAFREVWAGGGPEPSVPEEAPTRW